MLTVWLLSVFIGINAFAVGLEPMEAHFHFEQSSSEKEEEAHLENRIRRLSKDLISIEVGRLVGAPTDSSYRRPLQKKDLGREEALFRERLKREAAKRIQTLLEYKHLKKLSESELETHTGNFSDWVTRFVESSPENLDILALELYKTLPRDADLFFDDFSRSLGSEGGKNLSLSFLSAIELLAAKLEFDDPLLEKLSFLRGDLFKNVSENRNFYSKEDLREVVRYFQSTFIVPGSALNNFYRDMREVVKETIFDKAADEGDLLDFLDFHRFDPRGVSSEKTLEVFEQLVHEGHLSPRISQELLENHDDKKVVEALSNLLETQASQYPDEDYAEIKERLKVHQSIENNTLNETEDFFPEKWTEDTLFLYLDAVIAKTESDLKAKSSDPRLKTLASYDIVFLLAQVVEHSPHLVDSTLSGLIKRLERLYKLGPISINDYQNFLLKISAHKEAKSFALRVMMEKTPYSRTVLDEAFPEGTSQHKRYLILENFLTGKNRSASAVSLTSNPHIVQNLDLTGEALSLIFSELSRIPDPNEEITARLGSHVFMHRLMHPRLNPDIAASIAESIGHAGSQLDFWQESLFYLLNSRQFGQHQVLAAHGKIMKSVVEALSDNPDIDPHGTQLTYSSSQQKMIESSIMKNLRSNHSFADYSFPQVLALYRYLKDQGQVIPENLLEKFVSDFDQVEKSVLDFCSQKPILDASEVSQQFEYLEALVALRENQNFQLRFEKLLEKCLLAEKEPYHPSIERDAQLTREHQRKLMVEKMKEDVATPFWASYYFLNNDFSKEDLQKIYQENPEHVVAFLKHYPNLPPEVQSEKFPNLFRVRRALEGQPHFSYFEVAFVRALGEMPDATKAGEFLVAEYKRYKKENLKEVKYTPEDFGVILSTIEALIPKLGVPVDILIENLSLAKQDSNYQIALRSLSSIGSFENNSPQEKKKLVEFLQKKRDESVVEEPELLWFLGLLDHSEKVEQRRVLASVNHSRNVSGAHQQQPIDEEFLEKVLDRNFIPELRDLQASEVLREMGPAVLVKVADYWSSANPITDVAHTNLEHYLEGIDLSASDLKNLKEELFAQEPKGVDEESQLEETKPRMYRFYSRIFGKKQEKVRSYRELGILFKLVRDKESALLMEDELLKVLDDASKNKAHSSYTVFAALDVLTTYRRDFVQNNLHLLTELFKSIDPQYREKAEEILVDLGSDSDSVKEHVQSFLEKTYKEFSELPVSGSSKDESKMNSLGLVLGSASDTLRELYDDSDADMFHVYHDIGVNEEDMWDFYLEFSKGALDDEESFKLFKKVLEEKSSSERMDLMEAFLEDYNPEEKRHREKLQELLPLLELFSKGNEEEREAFRDILAYGMVMSDNAAVVIRKGFELELKRDNPDDGKLAVFAAAVGYNQSFFPDAQEKLHAILESSRDYEQAKIEAASALSTFDKNPTGLFKKFLKHYDFEASNEMQYGRPAAEFAKMPGKFFPTLALELDQVKEDSQKEQFLVDMFLGRLKQKNLENPLDLATEGHEQSSKAFFDIARGRYGDDAALVAAESLGNLGSREKNIYPELENLLTRKPSSSTSLRAQRALIDSLHKIDPQRALPKLAELVSGTLLSANSLGARSMALRGVREMGAGETILPEISQALTYFRSHVSSDVYKEPFVMEVLSHIQELGPRAAPTLPALLRFRQSIGSAKGQNPDQELDKPEIYNEIQKTIDIVLGDKSLKATEFPPFNKKSFQPY